MDIILRHSMKVHQFARPGFWEHERPSSLTLDYKRLRPLVPKLQPDPPKSDVVSVATFDLKSFVRPENGFRKHGSADNNKDSVQTESQAGGGTRWNPTQEQISILEMLYGGGMRTPNAQQIEQITTQLGKYGKIEGKNVFYWFQNHKARERQKQKRNIPCPHQTPTLPAPVTSSLQVYTEEAGEEEDTSIFKRKCRKLAFECLEEDMRYGREGGGGGGDRTLILFPLHPESS